MPVGRLLERMRCVQQRAFIEVVPDQLQADRHRAVADAGRQAHARQAGQAGGQREDVGQVAGQIGRAHV